MDLQQLHQLFLKSSGVSTDTRNILKNSIFFALKGDNFDGNKYAKEALQKGASLAIIDNEKYYLNDKYILVEDVLKHLQQLANLHRKKLKCPVLGITGTNGKTTTKELITAVLQKKYNVVSTKGNLNNHIGVPLTLLSAKLNTEFLVVEMGANHLKEIDFLCNLSEIDFGIITNIGKAHLEGFGSKEGVIKAKKELYDYINTKQGLIFINADDELLMSISEGINRVEYQNQNQEKQKSPFATIEFNKEKIYSKLIGEYNCTNILAACTIGKYFKVPLNNIKDAIENYTPSNNRSQFIQTLNNNSIILDAYNANPSSMKEAIKAFEKINEENKLYILGDMLELGNQSTSEHQDIINQLQKQSSNVILIGKEFGETQHEFTHFTNTEKAANWIKNNPINNHFILLKGSRGVSLEKLKEIL